MQEIPGSILSSKIITITNNNRSERSRKHCFKTKADSTTKDSLSLISFFVVVLGFELLTFRPGFLSLEPHPQPFLPLGIFRIGPIIYSWSSQDCDPPIYASCVARTQVWATTPDFLLVEIGVLWLSAWLASNINPPDLHLMSSWCYGCEPLYLAFHLILELFRKHYGYVLRLIFFFLIGAQGWSQGLE
jgi:hypothetical protein